MPRRGVDVDAVDLGTVQHGGQAAPDGTRSAAEVDHDRSRPGDECRGLPHQQLGPRRGTNTPGPTAIRSPQNSTQPRTCSSGTPPTRRSTSAASSAGVPAASTSSRASSSAKTQPAARSRATTLVQLPGWPNGRGFGTDSVYPRSPKRLRKLPISSMIMLLTGNSDICRRNRRMEDRRHGPLQEQPARHRVQPLRGLRPPGAARHRPPFDELDADTARSILAEVERLASNELAASLLDSDRNPPVFDPATGTVTMPESFKKSFHAYMDAEWWRLDLPGRARRHRRPPSACSGPSPSWSSAPTRPCTCTPPARASPTSIYRLGTEEQRKVAEQMVENHWGATMVLTEPDAGSDVGAGRTKATQQADGTWHIEGVKRFITTAEHDMAENIVHLVLARPEGAGPGTKGLSLFIVPKFHFDWETGELGERNGVQRHQRRAQDGPQGLDHVRADVRRARARRRLARRRGARRHRADVQGHRVRPHDGRHQGDRDAVDRLPQRARLRQDARAGPRPHADDRQDGAARDDHPPPRRPPHADDAEGVRRGPARAGALHGLDPGPDRASPSPPVRDEATSTTSPYALNDLLLPIVKGFGSEKSYELLGAQSLQTFGGSGYLQDYPLEQYIRDAKIDTLYEGTTAIQGMDLFFRKIVRDKGQALAKLLTEIQEFAKGDAGNGALRAERDLLAGPGGRPGHRRHDGRLADRVGRGRHQRLQGRAEHHPAADRLRRPGDRRGCCCARPRSPWRRWTPAPPAGTRRSTRARSPRRRSSPARPCRCSPRTGRSPRRWTTR